MQIATVGPGDTLWGLAQRYGVRPEEIARLNAIDDPSRLVPGQALLVPATERVHIIRPGDSLWGISRQYGVPMEAIASLNGLVPPYPLYPGMPLRIPFTLHWGPKRTIEVNGYLETKEAERDQRIVQETARYMTYFSLFQYIAQTDGSLTPAKAGPALEAIGSTDAVPMMVVTNFEKGTFSPEVAHNVLTDGVVRERLINGVLQTMLRLNYAAVNVDFEHIRPDDRDAYTDFLKELTAKVHEVGKLVSTALAPKTSGTQAGPWYSAHDYGAHGAIVDFVILMTYEWGWSGGPPMAVAPLSQVKRVLEYALTVIPREKIMMSAPLYGYNWTLPYKAGGKFAPTLSPAAATVLARDVGAVIHFDAEAQSPYFRYYDPEGKEHIVWFEDVRSLQAKLQLIKQYGLRGISFWALGSAFSQMGPLLEANFTIKKYK